MDAVDRHQAAAERDLDRIDDEADATLDPRRVEDDRLVRGAVGRAVAPDDYGIHVDDPDGDLLDEDLDAGLRDDREADLLDSIAEAFNARDLDGLMELLNDDVEVPGLLGYERANVPGALQGLWERRPSCCLVRGYTGTEHIGVLFEHDGTSWWRVAAVHVDDVEDGQAGVLEFSDDTALLEQATCDTPDADDLEEGVRWEEWEQGVGD
ncbi:MAG: hypothetical protein JJT89_00920 [Nitriliruptoraceae bacterium]|nr:hypothetical protein [Nitriliruptoraceae bacterium]